MKGMGKLLGAVGAAALAVVLTPFRFKSDKETGSYEVGALLWSLKKTAGEEKDTYTIELLPTLNKGVKEEVAEEAEGVEEAEEAPAEEVKEPAEEPAEAPVAEPVEEPNEVEE